MTASDSAGFFSEMARRSTMATRAFYRPGRPELGPYHPDNTFLSPFTVDRTKVSWYFRTPIEVKPETAVHNRETNSTIISYVATGETLQWASALLDVQLAAPDRRVLAARVDLVSPSGDSVALQTFQTEDCIDLAYSLADPARAATTPPWFYTLKTNSFFPVSWLRTHGYSLKHVFEVSGGQAAPIPECWATVAWVGREEESSSESFTAPRLFVPEIAKVAQGGRSEKTGAMEAAIGPEGAANEGAAFAFAWSFDASTDAYDPERRRYPCPGERAKVSIWCDTPTGKKYVLKDYPNLLCPRVPHNRKWYVWKTAVDDAIWPPPTIGLDSRTSSCPGAGHFILSASDVKSDASKVQFAAARVRILKLEPDGTYYLD